MFDDDYYSRDEIASSGEEERTAKEADFYVCAALKTMQERREWLQMAERRTIVIAAAAFMLGAALTSVGWLASSFHSSARTR